jgi:hypothetical protein
LETVHFKPRLLDRKKGRAFGRSPRGPHEFGRKRTVDHAAIEGGGAPCLAAWSLMSLEVV